jgi:heme-degrading monooxygenase HmoA
MIARTFAARTTRERAPAYADHLRDHVFPVLQGIDGYQGAMLLTREVDAEVEVSVITLWRSLDVVRGFAGDDLERAVVANTAATLLTDFDRRVKHFDVALRDRV